MIRTGTIILMLVSLFMPNCQKSSEEPVTPDRTPQHKAPSARPVERELSIGPENATTQTEIKLLAKGSLVNDSKVFWTINGLQQLSAEKFSLSSNMFRKGDIVQAMIEKNKKEYFSNKIRINNTPPAIVKSAWVPEFPKTGSTVTVRSITTDPDNDNVFFKYKWAVNGRFAGEESYLETDLKRGDRLSVEITPFDGEEDGRTIKLSSRIFNSLPVYEEGTPSFRDRLYSYTVKASDPDGDPLSYSLLDGPEGMTIDGSTGEIRWDTKDFGQGRYLIKVAISDNHGGKTEVSFHAGIMPKN